MARRSLHLLACLVIFWTVACAATPVVAPPTELSAELPAPPPSPEILRWAGDWVEHWPGVKGEDRYRITLIDGGRTLHLDPLTRTQNQVFGGFQWDGATLGFVLYLDNSPLNYYLEMDASGDVLRGIVRLPDGAMKRCVWYRLGTQRPSRPEIQPPAPPTENIDAWLGLWEESWPGRRERDRYRIEMTDTGLVVRPETNDRFQQISELQLHDGVLRFRLRFGDNDVAYRLTVRDDNHLQGTARMKSGKKIKVLWTLITFTLSR